MTHICDMTHVCDMTHICDMTCLNTQALNSVAGWLTAAAHQEEALVEVRAMTHSCVCLIIRVCHDSFMT